MSESVFLDHHSTTPLAPEAFEAMLPYLKKNFGNSQSQGHAWGWKASEAVEHSRNKVAQALKLTQPKDLIFTSGATESIFSAVYGWFKAHHNEMPLMGTTKIEHKATYAAFHKVTQDGGRVETLRVDSKGHLDLSQLEQLCQKGLRFFSLIHGHNEIGTVQRLDKILPILKSYGVVVHLDLAQSFGKVEIDLTKLNVHFASLSAHKFGGPQGVGALYFNSSSGETYQPPLGVSCLSPHERRLGTPPVALVVGMGEAARLASQAMLERQKQWNLLRDRLLRGLKGLDPELQVNGCQESRLPNNLNVTLPNLVPHKLSALASKLGVSSSSACTTGDPASTVLSSLAMDPTLQRKTLRFGLGSQTSESEIDLALSHLAGAMVPDRE